MWNACCLKTNTCCVSPRQHNGMVWKLWQLLTPSCFKQKMLVFALTLQITFLRYCRKRKKQKKNLVCTQQKSWASRCFLFPSAMKAVSVFHSLAESVPFFLCFCLTSHRLLPLLAESSFLFFFLLSGPLCGACLWCDILVLTTRLWERNKKNLRKRKHEKKRKKKTCSKAAKRRSQVLAEPLFFSAHCLRYATVHTKYNEEWLKQTQGKQILTRYSSWLFCVLLPPL